MEDDEQNSKVAAEITVRTAGGKIINKLDKGDQ